MHRERLQLSVPYLSSLVCEGGDKSKSIEVDKGSDELDRQVQC